MDILQRSDVGQQVSRFGRDPEAVGRLIDHIANLGGAA